MSSSSPGYKTAAYFRVASMAIGGYEFICTIPAEYHFYRQQYLRRSISRQCALFFLIRYLSIAVVTASNVGFFGEFSSLEACRRFMLVSPVLKALQTVVSQLILASRTYSISRKSAWVFWTMVTTLGITVPVEFVSNVYGRKPVHNPILHNCTSGNDSELRIAWVHYLVAMLFDLVAVCISSAYLWIYSATASRVSHFIRILLYEGLGYFVILTAVYVLNMVLYLTQSQATQSIGASLGYVVIFIMSQRVLLTQRKYADKYAATATELPSTGHEISISRRLDTTHEINEALRSQFETGFSESLRVSHSSPHSSSDPLYPTGRSRKQLDLEPGGPSSSRREGGGPSPATRSGMETEPALDVEVRIERTVSVRQIPAAVRPVRESYRRPRVMWEPR